MGGTKVPESCVRTEANPLNSGRNPDVVPWDAGRKAQRGSNPKTEAKEGGVWGSPRVKKSGAREPWINSCNREVREKAGWGRDENTKEE